jgi:hypothetical protein
MNLLSIIGVFLSILGFFGAIRFSSIFFGIFLVGLFLIIYNSNTKKEELSFSQKSTTLTKPSSHSVYKPKRFCTLCGAELSKSEDFCPICGDKVKK